MQKLQAFLSLPRLFSSVHPDLIPHGKLSSLSATVFNRRIHNMSTLQTQPPTAGIIVIGDEILKGQTRDTNGHFIAARLKKLGVSVKKISVIGDNLRSISEEVLHFSQNYTHVITTGGIGPTHDDVTFKGVAEAFNEHLFPHPELVAFISDYFKTDDLTSPSMKMAHIPVSSELVYAEHKGAASKLRYPVVRVRNVLVLPGIPKLMEKSLSELDKRLFGEHLHMTVSDLYLTTDEVSIATALNTTVTQHTSVSIGSYPQLSHNYFKTHITMEGRDSVVVDAAKQHFLQQIDPKFVVPGYVRNSVTDTWPRLQALLEFDDALRDGVGSAIKVLEQAMDQYSSDEICVCFNGGKDCLVVLHLFYALLQKKAIDDAHQDSSTDEAAHISSSRKSPPKLLAVYITDDDPFPQITEFVNETISRYNLECSILSGPLKSALSELQRQRPAMKAVIMGTRNTDPYSDSLTAFEATDGDWPLFIRVSPILDWQYSAVWDFIRGLYLPYCSLYDKGYSSLGTASNTVQNPHLSAKDRLGQHTYRPAYMLEDSTQERSGRT